MVLFSRCILDKAEQSWLEFVTHTYRSHLNTQLGCIISDLVIWQNHIWKEWRHHQWLCQ